MDVSAISATSLFGSSYSKESLSLRQVAEPVRELERRAEDVEPRRGRRGRRGLALGILKQEIRAAMKQSFRVATAVGSYSPLPGTGDDVVGETLAAAGQIAKASPLDAAEQLSLLRQEVGAASESVQDILGEEALDDVADAISAIEQGVAATEADAERNTVSSASVLEASTRLRQRSTITIRTQEGDVVRLDLRRRESMTATDVAVSGSEGSFASTEVTFSSKTRLAYSVRGDLNEQELAAIQTVFEQAESIASDFFGGDLGAAFAAASELSYDTDQLARVSMRMRERTFSEVSVATATVTRPVAAEPEPAAVATTATVAEPSPVGAAPVSEPVSEPMPAVKAEPVPETAVEDQQETALPSPADGQAADDFAAMLGEFLRATMEGFETGDGKRYFYSESFKLQLLKTAIEVTAEDSQAAAAAGAVIDGVTASVEPATETVES